MLTRVLIVVALLAFPPLHAAAQEGYEQPEVATYAEPFDSGWGEAEEAGQPAEPEAGTYFEWVRALTVAHELLLSADQLYQLAAIGQQQLGHWSAMWQADEVADGALGAQVLQAIDGILAGQPPGPEFEQALAAQIEANRQAKVNAWLAIQYGRIAALQLLTTEQLAALRVTEADFIPPESRLAQVEVTASRLYDLANQMLEVRNLAPEWYAERREMIATDIAAGLVPQQSPAFHLVVGNVLAGLDWLYSLPPQDLVASGGRWVDQLAMILNLKVAGATVARPEQRTPKDEFFEVLESEAGGQAWLALAAQMTAPVEEGGGSETE